MTSIILIAFLTAWISVPGPSIGLPVASKAFLSSARRPDFRALQSSPENPQAKFSEAIEDNSFFIEEAYNQERRVVQHIFGVYHYGRPRRDTFFSFTQEWPFLGPRHQLSYTIPYSWQNAGTVHGVNDILVNYRYQLFEEDQWAAVAPRISLVLPTGRVADGLGNGVAGVQIALPASKRLSDDWVVHANLVWTFLPQAKGMTPGGQAVRGDLSSYLWGGSLIFLASPYYNFLVESLVMSNAEFDDAGRTVHKIVTLLSPGFRYAVNFGHLQVVPGLALPITFSKDATRLGVFVYLSFEHPY